MDNAFNDSTNKSSKDLSISNDLKLSDWPLTFNLMNQLKSISLLLENGKKFLCVYCFVFFFLYILI